MSVISKLSEYAKSPACILIVILSIGLNILGLFLMHSHVFPWTAIAIDFLSPPTTLMLMSIGVDNTGLWWKFSFATLANFLTYSLIIYGFGIIKIRSLARTLTVVAVILSYVLWLCVLLLR